MMLFSLLVSAYFFPELIEDAVLESVFRKQNTGFKRVDGIHKERSLLHSVEFFRVILDEAHNIKDRACNTAKAAFALKTKRKLCLSGTPLQNRVCVPPLQPLMIRLVNCFHC